MNYFVVSGDLGQSGSIVVSVGGMREAIDEVLENWSAFISPYNIVDLFINGSTKMEQIDMWVSVILTTCDSVEPSDYKQFDKKR